MWRHSQVCSVCMGVRCACVCVLAFLVWATPLMTLSSWEAHLHFLMEIFWNTICNCCGAEGTLEWLPRCRILVLVSSWGASVGWRQAALEARKAREEQEAKELSEQMRPSLALAFRASQLAPWSPVLIFLFFYYYCCVLLSLSLMFFVSYLPPSVS